MFAKKRSILLWPTELESGHKCRKTLGGYGCSDGSDGGRGERLVENEEGKLGCLRLEKARSVKEKTKRMRWLGDGRGWCPWQGEGGLKGTYQRCR